MGHLLPFLNTYVQQHDDQRYPKLMKITSLTAHNTVLRSVLWLVLTGRTWPDAASGYPEGWSSTLLWSKWRPHDQSLFSPDGLSELYVSVLLSAIGVESSDLDDFKWKKAATIHVYMYRKWALSIGPIQLQVLHQYWQIFSVILICSRTNSISIITPIISANLKAVLKNDPP